MEIAGSFARLKTRFHLLLDAGMREDLPSVSLYSSMA
jgi:hypothetical protein